MRRLSLVLPALLLTATVGCGVSSPSPSSPTAASPTGTGSTPSTLTQPLDGTLSPPPADPGPCVVGFNELTAGGAPFTTHAACGLTIVASAANWVASTTYGHPAPFVQFVVPGGTTTTGDISLTAVGSTFAFVSVDIYSSTTKIPYEISGSAKGAMVFTLAATQNNTFGGFATITNPQASVVIDTLRIRLTNPAAPCCSNPVGLDNIRVVR